MILILTASPNADGLTAACGQAALRGAQSAGAEAEALSLNAMKIEGCRACGNGWGLCREENACVIGDAFGAVMEKLLQADGVLLITPVYWSQPSERMKFFLDRFRRCQAGRLDGKPIAMVAAAGGSGNGTANCLEEMERWARHVGATPADRIPVTRFNREEMLIAVEKAARRLASRV